ncbi:hypothetical protein BJX76DRAFT_333543 [Aspergillus varians]
MPVVSLGCSSGLAIPVSSRETAKFVQDTAHPKDRCCGGTVWVKRFICYGDVRHLVFVVAGILIQRARVEVDEGPISNLIVSDFTPGRDQSPPQSGGQRSDQLRFLL